jgi:acyl-CoA thioesterase FadM
VHDVNWCYDTSTGEPIAAMEGVDVCFNMTARRSMSLPDSARARSQETLFPHYAIS